MPFNKNKDGLSINIKLTPNARKTAICGLIKTSDNKRAIKVSINVVPEGGKANKALIVFLSKILGISRSSISLLSGDKSRLKTILIEGEAKEIEAQILEKIPNFLN